MILAVVGFTLAAVFAGVANAQAGAPPEGLDATTFWVTVTWMLILAVASPLAALTAAAARWQPRAAEPTERHWTISYPDAQE